MSQPTFTVNNANVDLIQKTATVSLMAQTQQPGGVVQLSNVHISFPFDPAGDQRETTLAQLATVEAKKVLQQAIQAL